MASRLQAVSNEVSQSNGCFRYTIPINVARDLGLEDGESPSIEWDADEREVTLSF